MSDTIEEQVSQEDTQTTVEEVLTSEPVVTEQVEDNTLDNLDLASIPEEEPTVIPEPVIYNEYEIKAISQLTEASGYIVDSGKLILITPVKEFPTPEEISALADTIKQDQIKDELNTKLMTLCSNLFTKIKTYLSSKYVTPDQQERYNIKAQAAKNNQVQYFVDEATLLGIEPEQLMAKVLEMSSEWEQAINLAAVKIDAVRVYLSSIITTDTEFVQYVIDSFNYDFNGLSLETPVVDVISKLKSDYQVYLTER